MKKRAAFAMRLPAVASAVVASLIAVDTAKATCPADWNHDNQVTVQDIFDFLAAYFGGSADYNHNGTTSLQDLFDFLTDWFAGCSFGGSVTISPSSGGFGTPISMVLASPGDPYSFDTTTSAVWSGRYIPTVGAASTAFQVDFSAADVREQSAAAAVVVVGSGIAAELPEGIELFGPGQFSGTMTLLFGGGGVISTPFAFTATGPDPYISMIQYPTGRNGALAPFAGDPGSPARVLETTLVGVPADDMWLSDALGYHYVITVPVEENQHSTVALAQSYNVSVSTYDIDGELIDRVEALQLSLVSADGDPTRLFYQSSLSRPIVFLDAPTNRAQFPNTVPVHASLTGSVRVGP